MKKIVIIAAMLVYSATAFSLSDTTVMSFQTEYGTLDTSSDAYAACIQQTSDGGYIAAGYSSNFGAGNDDAYLLKTDATGSIQWTRTFGTFLADDAFAVVETTDNGYAVAGTTSGYGGEHIFLLRTDPSGNLLWTKVYGTLDTTSDAAAYSLQQTADGGFILAGYISNFGSGGDDFYLLKTDGEGLLSWTRTYGWLGNDDANSVIQTADGGYVLAGTTASFGDTLGDFWVVKTNSYGDTLWTRIYGSNLADAADMANSISQTRDMGYLIAGVTSSASMGEFGRLIKTDQNGNLQWAHLYGTGNSSSDASFSSALQTSDGGYVATGYISNFGAGGDDYYIVKTDSSGGLMWANTFGSSADDDANYIRQTSDNGYVLAGSTFGFTNGGEHVYLVKTNLAGMTDCNSLPANTVMNTSITTFTKRFPSFVSFGGLEHMIPFMTSAGGDEIQICLPSGLGNINPASTGLTVYPNPATTEVTFALDRASGTAIVSLYDLNGKQVQQVSFSGQQVVLGRNGLPEGIYFYMVRNGSEILGKGKLNFE